jgi:hypothetical protein
MTDQHQMPNFFLVGAPKAATSSLYHYMGQHPDIFVPENKETHFFSWPEVGETYYDRKFVKTEAEFRALFHDRGEQQFAGDFSPSHLLYPAAAERIKAFQPEAKIIMILRDPVKRAISHYLMDCRLGCIHQPLLEVLDDAERYPLFYREYVQIGRYDQQVETYFSHFGRERVHVVIYEDFQKDPATTVREIFEFLGADADFAPNFSQAHNTYRMPRSRLVESFRNSSFWHSIRSIVPASIKNRAKPLMDNTEKPDMSREIPRLATLFADSNRRLAELLSRDLSHWTS